MSLKKKENVEIKDFESFNKIFNVYFKYFWIKNVKKCVDFVDEKKEIYSFCNSLKEAREKVRKDALNQTFKYICEHYFINEKIINYYFPYFNKDDICINQDLSGDLIKKYDDSINFNLLFMYQINLSDEIWNLYGNKVNFYHECEEEEIEEIEEDDEAEEVDEGQDFAVEIEKHQGENSITYENQMLRDDLEEFRKNVMEFLNKVEDGENNNDE